MYAMVGSTGEEAFDWFENEVKSMLRFDERVVGIYPGRVSSFSKDGV